MALHIVLAPILGRERENRMMFVTVRSMVGWLNKICEEASPSMHRYLEWPAAVVACIQEELNRERPERLWLKRIL